jgi:hypothetical protein
MASSSSSDSPAIHSPLQTEGSQEFPLLSENEFSDASAKSSLRDLERTMSTFAGAYDTLLDEVSKVISILLPNTILFDLINFAGDYGLTAFCRTGTHRSFYCYDISGKIVECGFEA